MGKDRQTDRGNLRAVINKMRRSNWYKNVLPNVNRERLNEREREREKEREK